MVFKQCKKCLLPAAFTMSDIDSSGTCSYCRAQNNPEEKNTQLLNEVNRKKYEENLELTLKECRRTNHYDALVCLSGGKDSLYLLYLLKEKYKLNVLAFTTDANLPAIAWDNINITLAKLQVDHLVFKPAEATYKKLFRYILKNQEARGAVYSVSYVYGPLFESDAMRAASEKNIPLVFAAYSPGQPEKERMVYEFDRELIEKHDWTPPQLKNCKEFTAEDLSRFWNPAVFPMRTNFPRYIAPFHAWAYNQDHVMKEVVKLGLVRRARFASPILSNYPINWLLMYSDLKHFNYNPYAPEFSSLIREGKASRAYWKILGPIIDAMIRRNIFLGKEVRKSLNWLELTPDELRINLPKCAYDPVYIAERTEGGAIC